MDMEKLIERCAAITRDKGFDVYQHATQLLLIGSEVAEALREVSNSCNNTVEMYIAMVQAVFGSLEGYRSEIAGEHLDASTIHSKHFLSEELADIVIRVFSYVGGTGLAPDFLDALERKIDLNETRPYKHGKKF